SHKRLISAPLSRTFTALPTRKDISMRLSLIAAACASFALSGCENLSKPATPAVAEPATPRVSKPASPDAPGAPGGTDVSKAAAAPIDKTPVKAALSKIKWKAEPAELFGYDD